MKLQAITKKTKDSFFNLLSNRKYGLCYVVEAVNWSIKWDGRQLTQALNAQSLVPARISASWLGLRDQIVHFGSANTFLTANGFRKPHKSNKLVLTWFHVSPSWERNKNIVTAQDHLSFLHTSCSITKNDLIDLGVKKEKIVVVPLGVDLSLFRPSTEKERQAVRQTLGIPKDRIVIGSFQKDGVGWGEGLEPKMVKGPDIFVSAVEKISTSHPVFVLLVGPARGYVEKNLQERGIPYKSIGFLGLRETAKYYKALDLYLVSSRVEGGPKALLEAMASGVPLVTTEVGMAPDIKQAHPNAFLSAELENVCGLVRAACRVIENNNLKSSLISNGLEAAQDYSWHKVAQKYCQKLYQPLL